MSSNVKVVARFRPPNALELREGSDITIDFEGGGDTTVKLKGGPSTGPEADGFTFDRVFPMNTRQQDVFEYGIKETVDDVLNGYNGTIFAYGQTGSGKTFTMMGASIDDESLRGIIPRITEQIFDSIMASASNLEYLVKVSYMEIYMEKIRDLLAPQNDNLQIHEEKNKGVYVKGLSDYYVGDQDDVYTLMRQGGNARAVSSTNMNAESSRSHSIFLVAIQQKNTDTGTQKTGNLYLVDLAGSEKVGKTGASGQTLEEAKKINKSLSALGMVINALTDGKSSHIPYRDSKLTRILQESLGGNSRTTLIINASPCSYNLDETISTLRFGSRAKRITNKARVNAELSPAELKVLLRKAQAEAAKSQQYIAQLEGELKVWRAGGKVAEPDRAQLGKLGTSTGNVTPTPSASSRPSSVADLRPSMAALAGSEITRDLSSRPETPTAVSAMSQEEKDEFLRRENELSDQLAQKEEELKRLQAVHSETMQDKEQEATLREDNKRLNVELNNLRLEVERIRYELKEAHINLDGAKELNAELSRETEELKKAVSERAAAAAVEAKDPEAEEKDRLKKIKVQRMMQDLQTEGFSDQEVAIRESLTRLDQSAMPPEVSAQLKQQMQEIAEQQRRLLHQLEESRKDRDHLLLREQDAENRYLDMREQHDKLVQQAQTDQGLDIEDVRVGREVQFHAERLELEGQISELKSQIDGKLRDIGQLRQDNEALQASSDELKRAFAITTAGREGGEELMEKVKEMERVRKTMSQQLAEFDTMKRSMMRDLQNRCEKVVELEISLDESREQYNNVVRSSNTKSQQKKMAMIERNLEQLTNVQKQLVEQNSSLKKEVAIAERKLIARNERIQNLEALLAESQDRLQLQNEKYETQMTLIRERFESAKSLNRTMGGGVQGGGVGVNFGRIAKPLRGGGPQAGPQPGSAAVAAGAPRHPGVSSVQQQASAFDSKSPKSRSSWFFSSS